VVDDVRSFAFSGHLIEVSDILEKKSPEAAMAEIMSKVGFGFIRLRQTRSPISKMNG